MSLRRDFDFEHEHEPTLDEIADAIDAGVDYIIANGWWNGDYVSLEGRPGDDRSCMVLAIQDYRPRDHNYGRILGEAYRVLARYLGLDPCNDVALALFDWNDSHTEDEVVDAMRRCAKEMRELAHS